MFQICLKGKVHIFKYLNIQACRMDKKPDTLDLPSLGKRCLPQPLTDRYWHIYFYWFIMTWHTTHLFLYHFCSFKRIICIYIVHALCYAHMVYYSWFCTCKFDFFIIACYKNTALMSSFSCIFPAWKIFIPVRTTGLTLELVVTMVTRGCLRQRSEFKHSRLTYGIANIWWACYHVLLLTRMQYSEIHKCQSAPCGILFLIHCIQC